MGVEDGVTVDRVLAARTDHEVLGLKTGANASEIRSAYRSRSKQLHPDKNADPRAEKAFQRLTEAQQALEAMTTGTQFPARPAPTYDSPSARSGPSAAEMDVLAAGVSADEQRREMQSLREECERLRRHERERVRPPPAHPPTLLPPPWPYAEVA